MKEQKSIKAADDRISYNYVHTGDDPYKDVQEDSFCYKPYWYDNAKNYHDPYHALRIRQERELALLHEEELLLEDFFYMAKKEFAKFNLSLSVLKNKLSYQDYNVLLKEKERILCSIKDLNHVLGLVRRKKGGYYYKRWNQFAGFNQKVQHEGNKYGLIIDGHNNLDYVGSKKDNGYHQLTYFTEIDKSKNLQLVPMGWDGHETFMIIDHTNNKIIIYDPNGDFYNLFKEQARLEKIDKNSVMKFLLGKDNAARLKNYDLFDTNGVWEEETGIANLGYCQCLNTSKEKPGEIDGACSFAARYWAETFLKEYFKHIENNKTTVIKEYNIFLRDIYRTIQQKVTHHAANLRQMLHAGFENFYQCKIMQEALFGPENSQPLLPLGIAKYFPGTIAKFQHLIEHYKYREEHSYIYTWEEAVKEDRNKRKREKNAPIRDIMVTGFPEIYGYLDDYTEIGRKYLNEMKKDPISYTKRKIPHLRARNNDADNNDLNASELKGHIHPRIYKNIMSKRRGNLNLDKLSNNNKNLNHSII